jgi:hypothetical protein
VSLLVLLVLLAVTDGVTPAVDVGVADARCSLPLVIAARGGWGCAVHESSVS